MAGYRACGGGNATTVLQAAFIVILLTIPSVSGALCRFASTATSQGSCIFPCRCTKGCNTITGECIDSGTCNDGSPRGYRWSGTACQIGNVAYNKTASQENYARGNLFPARMAVDGKVDQWKFPERCALPNHGQDSDAWWQVDLGEVYKISRVEIYSGNSECTTGHFGAHCQFQCSCRSGETCNEITGKCPSDCPSGKWGVGCMLNNDNYYNDPKGKKYLGKRSHATHRANGVPFTGACRPWTEQTLHPDKKFLDGSRKAAKNFCRNTDNSVNTWCYFDTSNKKRPTWAHCKLSNTRCVAGRFDANCDKECHCSSATDNCQLKNGRCDNGCAPHFEGLTCQENRLPSTFTVSVGKSSDRTGHKQCASHSGQAVNGAVVNKTCTAIGRYVSFQRNKGGEPRLTALCEVVVIGHRYISCDNCSSACNNIIGCEACPPGKQQPECKTDCVKGHYGINCGESCGKCKDISKCSIINGDCGGVCETGYYGVNCNKTCGNCKHNSACDIKNGVCGSGCETWFAPSNCTIYIEKPTFESSDKPVVADITKSSMTLSWPKARDMTPNLGGTYYVYIVRLIADGEAEKNVRQVAQDSDKSLITSQVTGLRYNKNYEVRVQPYREHNGEQDGGTATGVTKFKTNCKAPVIEHLTTSTTDWPTNTSTIVSWKAIHESGCDEITSIRLSYQRHAQNETWKDVDIEHVDQTKVTITDLSYDVYNVKLTATNNKNLSASIEIVITNLLTTTITTTTVAPTTDNNPYKAEMVDKGPLTVGPITGIAFAGIFVLVGVTVVVIIILRRRSSGGETTGGIPMGLFSRFKKGAGKDNVGLDVEEEDAGDEGNGEVRQVENPQAIYANMVNISHSVSVSNLAAYVEDKRRHSGFQKEFDELSSGANAKHEEAKKPHNKNKNRFVNIIAYDHTRVVLSEDSGSGDYINANHIMGYQQQQNAYIACQGPKPWTIEDMWRMVWQEKTNTIVMLANLYENGKEKCSQYWPEKGKTQSWDNFIAESVSEETFADYIIRKFTLKNERMKKMRKIHQFHFTAWPDKGTPDNAYPLLAFHRKVHSFDSQRRGPLLVHCSAGVGRTGTFIAIDLLTQQAAAEGSVDVFECVKLLRTQRISMVQTLDQYVYVYQAIIESNEVTVVLCSQLKDAFAELCKDKKLSKQFEHLNALKPLTKRTHCAALEPNNVGKNRVIDIIPDDKHRPFLTTPCEEGNDYINAVYVHGFKERNAYIIAQSPMASTVVDMWRLLYDHVSRTVITLDVDTDTDDCAAYWPEKIEEKCQYGPFEVELVESTENNNVTVREFKLIKSGRSAGDPTVVKQFHLTNGWNKAESVPTIKAVILDLLDVVEKWQQQSGNGPIIVHCSDGARRCGLVCAASYMLEHMKVEQEVDVFHAVQHVRTTRPQLVTDLTQYRFLYELALAYMSQFDTYANFQ